MNPIKKTITLPDGREITLETGKLAKQADGAVELRMGNTMLLATIVSAKEAGEGVDFMPLTVDYKEKFSSAGRFPGGFLKREGRASAPERYTGDIMGDLNKRRGRVLGMNPIGNGKQVIEADIPMMELTGYCTVLRSMTGGRGSFEYEVTRYEQTPNDIQDAQVKARANKVVDSADV